ncbi:exosome non-catalytic core subunit rrp4 [Saitozyma podzolica]|uniref:Exosome non-catalytic core subunit rrp4 n=1 Tax=Saitozyma podzolica TaxID=1890683 RepID=A0A427XRW4_9TREE|nr:exosome non-catalytic core subunit rrp4 [Saitozyma podzolica]
MFTISQRPLSSALWSDPVPPSTHRRHPSELAALRGTDDRMDVDVDDADHADLGVGSSLGGHGTYVENDQVVSSVTGTIERVNKLISVKPLKSRYIPEVGDLVIGRIVEVGSSRWRVDANARQDAVLMLSSVNLPGGVQRRKIESDALKMREFLAEGDLLVAEVQAFFGDGAISLHTRSLRYGKLRNGLLLSLPPRLIRRLKSHFHHIPPPCGPSGVDVILGLNGLVWVAAGTGEDRREGGEGFDAEGVYSDKNDVRNPPSSRTAISLVSNLINLFAAHNVPLSDTLLLDAHAWVHKRGVIGPDVPRDVGERLLAELVGVDVSAD